MKRFKKGSKEARAFMAKLRALRGGSKKKSAKKSVKKRVRAVARAVGRHVRTIRKAGRKIAKSYRQVPYTITENDQIVLEGAAKMAAKKRSRKRRTSRRYGFEGVARKRTSRKRRSRRSYGFEGRKRSRRSRRSAGLFMGGMGGGMAGNVKKIAVMGAAGAAGAVGAAYLSNMLPAGMIPAKIKPAVPLALALVILMFGKKIPMAQPLAFGAAMSGVLGFAKQALPTLPTLAGVDSAPELSAEDEQLLLGTPQMYGAVQEFSGMEGAETPADL